ncbi:hypothetical protein ILUMI_13234 [Ignelater luminosus]|uniref:rRNA biogenesis protein RRP36 n=1 Tax=Ignelater luminosus TaxID=2038154 RepID=A0A8K0CSS2_IGNLU|nr:hypothetical protein ILUMI_13234 [Ignelater luminosus]
MESNSDLERLEEPTEQESETLTERESIRKKVSNMSFEDLQKLKEKIGSKKYNKVVFGVKQKKIKTDFKRANKNRPREMSSKKRHVIQDQLDGTKKNLPRDPRFDPLCGTFDEKTFKSNYKFLNDVRKKERKQLENEYKDESDPQRQQKIKLLMQRMDNQIREQDKRDKERKMKEEENTNIRKKLMQGEKPVFKKKSEKRIEELVNKYEELKKTNKLQKHLERRHKKLAKKEQKNMKKNVAIVE